MGMTIDKCTNMLMAKEMCIMHEASGIDTDCNSHNCDNCPLCYEQGTMGEQREVLRFTVDILRKYQKIEQIYSDYLKYMNPDNLADKIGEVLEDGNV